MKGRQIILNDSNLSLNSILLQIIVLVSQDLILPQMELALGRGIENL